MKKRFVLYFISLILMSFFLLILSGCNNNNNNNNESTNISNTSNIISGISSGSVITDYDFTLKFETKPALGYEWNYTINDNSIVKCISISRDNFVSGNSEDPESVTGKQEFNFKAESMGETDIVFEYGNAETGKVDKKTYYHVVVDKDLTVSYEKTREDQYLNTTDTDTNSDAENSELTVEEAEKILSDKLGKYDSQTGNEYSIGFENEIKKDGKKYYNFRVSWLVIDGSDGDSSRSAHLSYVGNFIVSKETGECSPYNNQ